MTAARPVLQPDALYLGDNGRCLCGEHSGTSARYTGRDLSGQKVQRVTPADAAEALAMGFTLKCERCGRTASTLYTVQS